MKCNLLVTFLQHTTIKDNTHLMMLIICESQSVVKKGYNSNLPPTVSKVGASVLNF